MATMGIADYSLPEHEGHFRTNSLFIGGNVRRAIQEGRGDYTPIFLSEIEALFSSGAMPIDVALLQCTPPDAYGYMSLGPAIDVSLTVAQYARHVIGGDQRPDAAHAGRCLSARQPRGRFHRNLAPAGRVPAARGDRAASRHRAQRGGADSRRGHHSDRHRRHSGSHAGAAQEPQGPGDPLGDGARRRHRSDPERAW